MSIEEPPESNMKAICEPPNQKLRHQNKWTSA